MVVIILAPPPPDDEHAAHMHAHLLERGVDVEWIDSAEFPQQLQATYVPTSNVVRFTTAAGRSIASDEIRSVYWRTYSGIEAQALPDPEQSFIAENDARSFFESVLMTMPVRWVNGWNAYRLHRTKPAALAMVSALELKQVEIPATTVTNTPLAVREFVSKHPDCIFKPVQGGAHTRVVTEDHLTDEALGRLAVAPVTIQQNISGFDIRVFVCGERVMACEIQTEKLDFRDDDDPTIVPVELPEGVASDCLAIARKLELLWTGIDLRRTDDGQYFYFEANPSPMFMGFEERCGLPLTKALGDLLCVH